MDSTEIRNPKSEIYHVLERFRQVRVFIFDIDGVLTDNRVLVSENGDLLRTMHVRDGEAIKRAIRKGYRVAVITGMRSAGVAHRLRFLGIAEHDLFIAVQNKLEVFEDWCYDQKIDPKDCLYMGDDVPDLRVMQRVGLPCCPSDAVAEILAAAEYVSPLKGGDGCGRDVIEKVLKLNDHWDV